MAKDFDVVVFGATGFTGALIARYFLQSPEAGLKWAIAGRSAKKLDQVKHQLTQHLPTVSRELIDAVPVVIADSANEDQLTALVKQTKVVLTVVGPYKLYGELLVKACAENGVHYCDLTGEIIWIDEMVAKYGAIAQKTGAVLVNSCGFDSVPADLTVFKLADHVKTTKHSTTSQVTLAFTTLIAGTSGGTLASAFNIFESSNADLAKSMDPFLLTDEATRDKYTAQGLRKSNSISLKIKKEKDLNVWSSLFVGAAGDQAIVHRSNFLQNGGYSDKFVYRERLAVGGLLAQVGITIGLVIAGALLYCRPTRALIRMLAPKPGEGPSEETMQKGKFVAKSVAYDENGKLAARATTVGVGEPGYLMTSKVIAECAVCLAKGELSRGVQGGFYTPASAFGHHLARRLESKQIMTIEVTSV